MTSAVLADFRCVGGVACAGWAETAAGPAAPLAPRAWRWEWMVVVAGVRLLQASRRTRAGVALQVGVEGGGAVGGAEVVGACAGVPGPCCERLVDAHAADGVRDRAAVGVMLVGAVVRGGPVFGGGASAGRGTVGGGFDAGLDARGLGARQRLGMPAAQPGGVGDHRQGAERHGGRCDDRAQAQPPHTG